MAMKESEGSDNLLIPFTQEKFLSLWPALTKIGTNRLDLVLVSKGLKFSSRLGKGIVSENRLLCCVPDMAYGSCPIWRISEKSTLAIEIDLNWSRRFVSVELGRLPNTLSCKTLLICPICISMVLIEALWFLIAALVESRISLIMIEFSSCLLADSAINLVDRVHPTMYSRLLPKFFLLPFVDNLSFVELAWIADKTVRSFSTLGLEDVQCAIFSKYFCHLLNAILASVAVLEATESIVMKFFEKLPLQLKEGILVDHRPSEFDSIRLGVSKSLLFERNFYSGFSKGESSSFVKLLVMHYLKQMTTNQSYRIRRIVVKQIRRLDSKTQYDVLIRRFDTSYPTGGYGVSGDQSKHNTI
ncbi:hypothetical protein Tco_0792139 [Tanacetum coccineum]